MVTAGRGVTLGGKMLVAGAERTGTAGGLKAGGAGLAGAGLAGAGLAGGGLVGAVVGAMVVAGAACCPLNWPAPDRKRLPLAG